MLDIAEDAEEMILEKSKAVNTITKNRRLNGKNNIIL